MPRYLTGEQPLGETDEHWRAKVTAVAWLWRRGVRRIAVEVPLCGVVIDVMGWADARRRGKRVEPARVIAIEAKGHRSDWLRESRAPSKFYAADLVRSTTERYIIAPPGVFDAAEVPAGWGILSLAPRVLRASGACGSGDAEAVAWTLSDELAKRSTYHLISALPLSWRRGLPEFDVR